MWKAWRASSWMLALRLPLRITEATIWLSEYHTTLKPKRWLANGCNVMHTALSSLCAVSTIDQFWWDTNSTSDCNWTNAPQGKSEASEKVILAGRDLAPNILCHSRRGHYASKINLRNGILHKQYFRVPRNSTADHREKKSRHNMCNRTHTVWKKTNLSSNACHTLDMNMLRMLMGGQSPSQEKA